MSNQRPDVVELLEKEKKWHTEQTNRIDLALSALRGETLSKMTEPKEKPKIISWSLEIDKLFNKHDKLTMKDLRNKLAKEGIPEALERGYYPTIFSTLKRKIEKGELEKEGSIYCKKRKRLLRRIDAPTNDVSEDKDLSQQ